MLPDPEQTRQTPESSSGGVDLETALREALARRRAGASEQAASEQAVSEQAVSERHDAALQTALQAGEHQRAATTERVVEDNEAVVSFGDDAIPDASQPASTDSTAAAQVTAATQTSAADTETPAADASQPNFSSLTAKSNLSDYFDFQNNNENAGWEYKLSEQQADSFVISKPGCRLTFTGNRVSVVPRTAENMLEALKAAEDSGVLTNNHVSISAQTIDEMMGSKKGREALSQLIEGLGKKGYHLSNIDAIVAKDNELIAKEKSKSWRDKANDRLQGKGEYKSLFAKLNEKLRLDVVVRNKSLKDLPVPGEQPEAATTASEEAASEEAASEEAATEEAVTATSTASTSTAAATESSTVLAATSAPPPPPSAMHAATTPSTQSAPSSSRDTDATVQAAADVHTTAVLGTSG